MKKLYCFALIAQLALLSAAQVKIGDNPETINANSVLELESGSQGFLGPRVAINDVSNSAPLSATVPEGMLVYSEGGTVENGFYYWDGSQWVKLITSADKLNIFEKSASCTLAKNETFVVASNDITITLPEVTSADNGLEITVKNMGNYTDLVIVQGYSGALIDDYDQSRITRFISRTYIAFNGQWMTRARDPHMEDILDVSPKNSWHNLNEAFGFLAEHMSGPTIIRLSGGDFEIANTITIDLPYSVTIQGASYGSASIIPAASLSGKPMFRCISESYFKMLDFVGGPALAGYGTHAGEDAIRFIGANTYNEIKDAVIEGFYNGILDSSNAELWLFECDIYDATANGLLIHSADAGTKVRISETDFINCAHGVNMRKGSNAQLNINAGVFDCSNATDTAICYNPSGFSFSQIIINNNAWNNVGHFIEGFDFTRTDGRDANAEIANNLGTEDRTPHMKMNVVNNASATTISSGSTWYKANWTNTSSYSCKWKIENNKVTYQPVNHRDACAVITGNITCSATRTITIALVKNGNTSQRFGETNLRITAASQPFQFSTVIYLENISPGDYFELYCMASSGGLTVTFDDVQWYMNAQ